MRRFRIKRLFWSFAVLMALGCEPDFDYLEIDQRSVPPGTVNLDGEPLVLQEGLAVLVAVEPISDNCNDYEEEDRVRLRSMDPDVFDVMPGQEDREFVLMGVALGQTCMEVRIENKVETCIGVSITPQWTGI